MRARVLLLAGLLVLGGCAGARLPGSDPGDALTVMGFGLPDEIAKTRVDLFKKQSGVELALSEGKLDAQQFLSAVAVKQPPDVVYLERVEIGSYATQGAIQPLDACVKERGVDVSAFRRSALAQSSAGGKLYALPDFNQVNLMIVNNAAARAAGVDPAAFATGDWARLADLAGRLTGRDGGRLTRIGFDPKVPELLPMWARAAGVSIVDDRGNPHLDDPGVVEALAATAAMVRAQADWGDYRAFRETFDLFGAKNPYVVDQLAAMPIETWYLNVLASTTPDVDITVLPPLDRQGNPYTWAGGSGWAIPKGARHPDRACAFIASMTSVGSWVAAAKARKAGLVAKNKPYTGTFTGNRLADERIFAEVYEPVRYPAIARGVQVALDLQDRAFSHLPSPVGAEIKKAYEAATTRVLLGRQSPRDSLAQAQREAMAALDWRR